MVIFDHGMSLSNACCAEKFDHTSVECFNKLETSLKRTNLGIYTLGSFSCNLSNYSMINDMFLKTLRITLVKIKSLGPSAFGFLFFISSP
jgi:hypothetical protein